MRWLKSLFGEPKAVAKEAAKLDAAHDMGRKAASAMVADLDGFMAWRFGHIKEAYLKVLDDGVLRIRSQDRFEHSPILLARAELAAYQDQVKDLGPSMTDEILDHMTEWQGVFDQMGLQGEVERVAKVRVDDLMLEMTLGGLSKLMEHADDLKPIDDKWRRENPAQAAIESLD